MKRAIYLLIMIVCLTGCKSTKQTTKSIVPEETKYLSAKMQITAPMSSGSVTLNGTMKLKSGDRMQMSVLMPILRSEMFRLELSSESCLVVDRLNSRYALLTADEMSQYLPAGVTYDKVESLLINYAASSQKYELSGSELGLPSSLQKAKVTIYDISDKEIEITPTTLSSKYTKMSTSDLLNMLNSVIK